MKNQEKIQSVHQEQQQGQKNKILQTFKRQRSKSKLGYVKTKQYYLTDTQASSSDHTKSSSQINLAKIQYASKLAKLQKENLQLKEAIIKYRKYDFYQLDQQKLKTFIIQNQLFKRKIVHLQAQLQQKKSFITQLQLQNEYLNRNTKIVKQKLQQLLKKQFKQKKDRICCQYCTYCNQNQSYLSQKKGFNYQTNQQRESDYKNQNRETLYTENPFLQKKYQGHLNKAKITQHEIQKQMLRNNKSGNKNRSTSRSINKLQGLRKKHNQKILFSQYQDDYINNRCLKTARSVQSFNFKEKKIDKQLKNRFKNQNFEEKNNYQRLPQFATQDDSYFTTNKIKKPIRNISKLKQKCVYFN